MPVVNVGFGLWQWRDPFHEAVDERELRRGPRRMMGFTNDAGDPLGLVPNLLVVPPMHESAARKVVAAALTTGGATNEWAGSAELLVSPWL